MKCKMSFKNFGLMDIALTKAAVFFATLFLVSAWQDFTNLVVGIHWAVFLVIALALSVKPMMAAFKK